MKNTGDRERILRILDGTRTGNTGVEKDVDVTVVEKPGALTGSAENQRRREFEELVRRHHQQAFNVAYRIAGNRTDAEDLLQETFVRAFRFFGNYRRELPFESWLYKIMSNLWIDTLRKRPRSGPPVSLDQTLGDTDQKLDVPDPGPGPEESLIEGTLDARIQEALSGLRKEFRIAVILADIEGMSYEEIADVMKCSIGTVRSRIHRGRQAMKKKLGSLERFLNEEV